MDLIYTNSSHVDQGALLDYDLDLAFGADENNFECRIAAASHCCEAGSMLYIEGTEYGGIIDSIKSDSSTDEVIYSGRTWHGVLGSKIIMPLQTGEASTAAVTLKTVDSSGGSLIDRYLIISGDANACIGFILSRVGLSTLFEASSVSAGVNINQYQFDRFTDAYRGITKMLSSAGLKPVFTFTDGKVIISASEKHDFTVDEEFDSELIDFQAKKNYKTVNHLICLGTGELENRMVVHLYADTEGNISQTQTQFGLDEYVATFDYSNVTTKDELISSGTEKLQELWNQNELSVDFDESMDTYDVGDIVGTFDSITGLAITATITKKIVKIKNGQISIDVSTDSVTSSRPEGSGPGGNVGKNLDNGQVYQLKNSIENNTVKLTTAFDAVNSLDDEALFGKSYRDIFIAANIVQGGDFENGVQDDWTLYNSPLISGEAYSSPGNSLKCFCSGTSKYIAIPEYAFLPGHTYYLGYRIRVDRYVSGNCGVQTFKNTYHNAVTEGFTTVSNQYCYSVTGSGLTSKSYIGCFSSADADAYLDDVVILDLTELFGAPPTKEVMDGLYGDYIALLTEGSTAEKSSEYVISAKPLREYSDAECKAAFVERLNQRAAALGMEDSVFANASGLTTESLSSCRDLLKLGLAACTSPRVMQALCTKSLTPTQKGGAVRNLSLSHLILSATNAPTLTDYYPLLGGKGGSLTSPKIKNHLVFCDVDGKLAAIALMGGNDTDNLFGCEKELCDMLSTGATAGDNLTALQAHGAYAAMFVPENPGAYLCNYSPAQLVGRIGAVAYNADTQFIPASITKVLTALVAAEYLEPWETVTVAASDGDIGGSGLVFVEGDTYSFAEAMAGMLLPSSNQMADAIARTVGQKILQN